MIDFGTAKILSHWRNIQRCVTLLATELSELERQYLHKRIAEERAELERLRGTQPDHAGAVMDYARHWRGYIASLCAPRALVARRRQQRLKDGRGADL